jgi:hypothetical protein
MIDYILLGKIQRNEPLTRKDMEDSTKRRLEAEIIEKQIKKTEKIIN